MPLHRADEQLRLRLREARQPLLPLHERGQLPRVPRPLGLVKNYDVVRRCSRVAERGVTKVVNVLNEGFDRRATGADPGPRVGELRTVEIIAGQGLPQYRDQRPIARQEDGMRRIVARAVTRGHVEADERLAGPGYPGDEDNRPSAAARGCRR